MKNNETNNRRIPAPKSTMSTNSGAYGVNRAAKNVSQRGDGADFAFNGQMGDGVNRMTSRETLCVNPNAHMVKNPDAINHGLLERNRTGNASDSSLDRMTRVGPSVTRDANSKTISTAGQGAPVASGSGPVQHYPNPNAIYMRKAVK